MKLTTSLFLLLPLLFSCSIGAPSERKAEKLKAPDGTEITCYQPPPDVVVTGGKASAELTAIKLGEILQAKGGVGVDVERIRQELPPDVAVFELIDFRMCVRYANGLVSKEAFQTFNEQIAPAYRNNPPAKTVSNTRPLVETCGPSFTTKRPAAKFVPYWASVVETLRQQRNIQYHDLENLMQVRGRTPVEMGMIDPFEEVFFTLDCLERIGYLKMEKFDPPRNLSGTIDNRKIIFSDPLRPVPN